MAKSKPVTIGDKSYATQAEANAFIKELLNSQQLRKPIAEPHHSFLLSLLSLHPRAKEKIGVGVKHFTVEPAMGGTRCFYVTRVDGTRDDFATKKCVRGRE
ncbi:MAG TPA: DCL family protein [Terriglobales bacterium]|nr:DCL family protein [Terriglobales bacterium]